MRGYYFADEIINEALLASGMGREKYAEASSYFLRAMRDFKLFNITELKQAHLPIDPLLYTVKIPDDCIRIISVGVSVNREFFSFTLADDMVKPSDPIGRELITSRGETASIDRSPTTGYGAKSLNVTYYYSIDSRKNRLILNRAAVDKTRYADETEVIVKYVSNDVDNLKETRVGMDAVNMLMAYVEWKLVASKPKEYTAQYRNEKKADFLEAEASYRLLNIPDVGELMDAIYETSGQNIRF